MGKYSEQEIKQHLTELNLSADTSSNPQWALSSNKLHKSYRFTSFVDAFGFMTQVALVAEKIDHHPDWKNIYNRVDVELTSHDVKGITSRDFRLARAMDEIFANSSQTLSS